MKGIEWKERCKRIVRKSEVVNFRERKGNKGRKDNGGGKGYMVVRNKEWFIVVWVGKNEEIKKGW